MLENWLLGISQLAYWQVPVAIVAGVALGIVVGAMPGLSGPTGMALLIPFTYMLSPIVAIVLLVSLYLAAEYGGSITAIAINTPGTPSGVITAIDGYEMTRQGKSGRALSLAVMSSVFGGLFSTIVLILFSIPLARFAVAFGPVQYFALGVFGLTIIASLVSGNWLKGLVSALFGLLIVTIGTDPISGEHRYTFGRPELWEGIGFIPAMLGLFAITEVFRIIEQGLTRRVETAGRLSSDWMPLREFFGGLWKTLLRSSIIGTLIGVVPGAGASIGSIVSYNEAKRFSKTPEAFGKGTEEGVCASETANNATVGGAMVPLLTLGIPGSGSTAVLLGALMLHGLHPGPLLFTRHPDIVYGLFTALILANFVMLVLGLKGITFWLRVVQVSPSVLAPLIFAIAFIGAYSIGGAISDVIVMLVFGVVGYFMRKFNFPLIPMIIALVLGEMVEVSMRRALIVSDSGFLIFLTDPISATLLGLGLLSLLYTIVQDVRGARRERALAAQETGSRRS